MWHSCMRAGAAIVAAAALGCTVIDIDITTGDDDLADTQGSPGDTTSVSFGSVDPVTTAPPAETASGGPGDTDVGQTSTGSTTVPDEGNTFVLDPDLGQTSTGSTTEPDEGNTFVISG